MNLDNALQVRQGLNVKIDEFAQGLGQWRLAEIPSSFDPSKPLQKEWFLEARICTRFWANNAQLDMAEKEARAYTFHILNSEYISVLTKLRHHVMSGDRMKSLSLIDELCDKMAGKNEN